MSQEQQSAPSSGTVSRPEIPVFSGPLRRPPASSLTASGMDPEITDFQARRILIKRALRQDRKRAGLTLKEMAAHLRVTEAKATDWESEGKESNRLPIECLAASLMYTGSEHVLEAALIGTEAGRALAVGKACIAAAAHNRQLQELLETAAKVEAA